MLLPLLLSLTETFCCGIGNVIVFVWSLGF